MNTNTFGNVCSQRNSINIQLIIITKTNYIVLQYGNAISLLSMKETYSLITDFVGAYWGNFKLIDNANINMINNSIPNINLNIPLSKNDTNLILNIFQSAPPLP